MKKALVVGLVLAGTLMMTGCSSKFEPTESTVFVTSKGTVKSAVMELFEESYYDFDELTKDIQESVDEYCGEGKEGAITIEALTEVEDLVTLQMNYASVADYAEFNDVILFSGTVAEAIAAGYQPKNLVDVQGQPVELTEEESQLKVIVTEEAICIQTQGRIKCASKNVTIMDKKLAKALEAEKSELAFVLYK